LNYRLEFSTNLNGNEADGSISKVTFLKKVIVGGLLSTPIDKLFEGLFFGPELQHLKHNRSVYLTRRLRDIVVSGETDLEQISRYISFFQMLGTREDSLKIIYDFFYPQLLSNNHSANDKLVTLLDCFGISMEAFNLCVKDNYEKMVLFYKQDILTYSESLRYKDYFATHDEYVQP